MVILMIVSRGVTTRIELPWNLLEGRDVVTICFSATGFWVLSLRLLEPLN